MDAVAASHRPTLLTLFQRCVRGGGPPRSDLRQGAVVFQRVEMLSPEQIPVYFRPICVIIEVMALIMTLFQRNSSFRRACIIFVAILILTLVADFVMGY